MTIEAESDYEKAKILYEYMQERTRYVSIQIGISGWQPFKALTVDKNGYGDCKALSNYMFAMLKAVGVKFHYAIVNAGEDSEGMIKEFSSNQFNHAILCIPNNSDTVWLECTSQVHPFGYIGSFTDDRDVLLISPHGGKPVHTKSYSREDNQQKRNAEITISSTGNIEAVVKTIYTGIKYEKVLRMFELSEEDKEKRLQKSLNLPNVNFNKIAYENKKTRMPEATENLQFLVNSYVSSSSKRLFIPINFLNKHKVPKEMTERKTKYCI